MSKKTKKPTKDERLQAEVAKAVGAGRKIKVETPDFSDPDRPPSCLEVDFPILPINQLAQLEQNAGKPIYQVSKWWARRRSSVFRSTLLAAAMKAPEDPAEAAKAVWEAYYANHQTKGALAGLKVLDPFMGGGTTVVEGSRLGLQMEGLDLNPVAWFVTKTELAQPPRAEVEALLAEVEAEVKPQLMPMYACDCPRGHRGRWTKRATGELQGPDFDPLALSPSERAEYDYEGPEVVYVFWAKHGPCQRSGCRHRTPILPKPVMAEKTLSLRCWEVECKSCGARFDLEEHAPRMAPAAPLVVAEGEPLFAHPHKLTRTGSGARADFVCPSCGAQHEDYGLPAKPTKKKKVQLSLLVHPRWLAGEAGVGADRKAYGGSATDPVGATVAWNQARAKTAQLVEVRGPLPDTIPDPLGGPDIDTRKATITKRSHYACGACGTEHDVMGSFKASEKTGPIAAYAIQGYCPDCKAAGEYYNGRFFAAVDDSAPIDAAEVEWAHRKEGDLATHWPRSELPYGQMTHVANGDLPKNHGYTHWWKMFHPRQLLVHTQLLRAIQEVGEHTQEVREVVLSVFQQYLRNQSSLTFWHISRGHFTPGISNPNFHSKSNPIEVGVFTPTGYGPWTSTLRSLDKSLNWIESPWELVSNAYPDGTSEKVYPGDPPRPVGDGLSCASATELSAHPDASIDLVITDPPFGGLLHYSELSDFFYVWLRLALKERYPEYFGPEYVPKSLEVVANKARQPDDPDGFYQRLLTESWREAERVLKPGGLLAFTFHHSEDEPWLQVLQSLFDAGFTLTATYPIRSDEIKGKGEVGAKKVEYDIIHVCRKRSQAPKRVSWAKMRREILRQVRGLKDLLEHHQQAGLPAADLEVIKRGKALEFYSKHYGEVYESEDRKMSIRDAVLGVLQLLDEDLSPEAKTAPDEASPYARQLLRMFAGAAVQPQDQIQKMLRGTGMAPSEFESLNWVRRDKKKKRYHRTPFSELATRDTAAEKPRDYDQAAFLIGACEDKSGLDTEAMLKPGFKPTDGLRPLLQWFSEHAPEGQAAAERALRLFDDWQRGSGAKPASAQMELL